jgi:hypothetical protein
MADGLARRWIGIVLALSCPGCDAAGDAPSRAHTITEGTADDGDPGVVALVETNGLLRCTGTLVAPRAVLTAAHCAIEAGNHTAFFGSEIDGPGESFAIIDFRAHPGYSGETGRDDIAVLFLDAAPPVTPALLPDRALDAAFVGANVRLVGFGQTAADTDDSGLKREGIATVSQLDDTELELVPAPSQTCLGDSGGPAFAVIDGVEVLVGVTARGDPDCALYAISTRVDAHLASFVQPYLDETAPGSAQLGEPCLYAAQCQSGVCAIAPDEPLIRYCSRSCGRDADCPDEMECNDEMCAYPLPTPGAMGAPCVDAAECVSEMCAAPPGSDDLRCTHSCLPGDGACGDEYECVNTVGTNFICVPLPPATGCTCSTSRGRAPTWLLLAVAIAWALPRVCGASPRRRRRLRRRPW